MAVAKRQGREKPGKIEWSKVKGGPRTGVRTSGRAALLPKHSLHRTGPGGRKTYKKRSQRVLSLSLSLSLSRARAMGTSSLRVFGSTCPHTAKMDFPAVI